MKHKVDILNLEWATNSRDTNIVDPVLVSLHDRYGYSIKCSSVWYGLFKILWYKPRILIMANDIGAMENVKLFYFAKKLGILTVSLISEGLQINAVDKQNQRDMQSKFFWGNNEKQDRIWDLKLLWSKTTRGQFYEYVPNAKYFNLKVSGGTGFDRYKFLNYENRDMICKIKGKEYKKVILLIGYSFDLFPLLPDKDLAGYDKSEVAWLYEQRKVVRKIYKDLISQNKDTLFILKHHPGSQNLDDTEFSGLSEQFDNTIEIHREIEISILLGSSDIVIAFDSTTCLEAWLLGKSTILVNPSGTEFARSSLYKGSVIVASEAELSSAVSEYFSTGKIKGFVDKKDERDKLIEEQIQYDDGFNYLRASKLIHDYIAHNSQNIEVRQILDKKIIVEFYELVKHFLLEFTPIGYLKANSRNICKKRSAEYSTNDRKLSLKQYRRAICKYEKINQSKVKRIVDHYNGE